MENSKKNSPPSINKIANGPIELNRDSISKLTPSTNEVYMIYIY